MVKERFYKTEVVPPVLDFQATGRNLTGCLHDPEIVGGPNPQGRRTLGYWYRRMCPPCRISVAIMEWITRSRYPRLASIWNMRDMLTPNLCAITHPSFSGWRRPCAIMNRAVGGITTRPSRGGRRASPSTD